MINLKSIHSTQQLIYRLLVIFTLALIPHVTHADNLTASVDRNEIGAEETLILTVAADSQTQKQPDFSALKNDFDILNTSTSRSISITNGHTESVLQWQLTLAPKHTGKLLIPSFKINDAISDAIEIQVNKQAATNTNSNSPVHIEVELSKNTAYVQEQVLVKIKLISDVSLAGAELQPLELKNNLLISLDQRSYQITNNGKPQLVVETDYALFPQVSGEIIIPSLLYTITLDNRRDFWDAFGQTSRNNTLRLRTEEQHLTVQPIPDKNFANTWQPANELTLHETWSSNLDHLKAGEPVTRTITISADGLTGEQIIPVSATSLEGFTFYPDQAQTKTDKSARGVEGTRTETTAIIPNQSGTFTLPEVKVNWWSTKTQSMQTASLPAKTVTVIGNVAAPISSSASSTATTTIPAPSVTAPTTIQTSNSPWLWLSNICFALLSLGLGVYVYKLKSIINELAVQHSEDQQIISEKEKNIWDSLKSATAAKDALSLRKAVLSWAKFHWPSAAIHSLDDIAKLGDKVELTRSLKKLDEILYSNHPADVWNPHELLQQLNECRKEKNAIKKFKGLKPLYNN